MTTLVGLFFSFISILGFFKGAAKTTIRRYVILCTSLLLILGQILFMNSALPIDSHQFVGFSGLLSGIILILAFQRNEAW